MSSELSARAISQIAAFFEDDYWPKMDDNELSHELRRLKLDERAQHVSAHFCSFFRTLLKGHRFLKRHRVLQSALKEKDVQDIFAHGKPLVFEEEDYRRLLVPMIVEVCHGSNEELSTYPHVGLADLQRKGRKRGKTDTASPR